MNMYKKREHGGFSQSQSHMNIVINSNIAIFFTMIYRGNKSQYRPALALGHFINHTFYFIEIVNIQDCACYIPVKVINHFFDIYFVYLSFQIQFKNREAHFQFTTPYIHNVLTFSRIFWTTYYQSMTCLHLAGISINITLGI